jgi:uncharacterized protein (DUF58 family)
LLQFLEAGQSGGVTDLNLALRDYALRGGRPGLLLLLSDMLSPAGYRDGLNTLLARGFEAGVIHILSPDELDPPLEGDLKLVDVETAGEAEVTLDAVTEASYRERLRAWQGEMAGFCAGRGVHYVPVSTAEPWEQLVLRTLRAQGLLQ